MELLDRYLQAVRKHLPWQRQDDIIAELRANLESQLEEKQEELGRPLTPGEAEHWIGGLGSPVQMAAHYQPQQYLIGPAIYPVYLYILRLASMWAIIIYTIVSAITILVGSASMQAVAEAAVRLPGILIQTAAWITLVFAAIEFVAVRYPEKFPPVAAVCAPKWSPRDLPPLQPAVPAGKKRRSYVHAVTEVIFGFIFLTWLLLVPRYPFLMFGPGVAFLHASPYHPAPVWITFYWFLVALNLIQLAWRCMDLLRGTWQQPNQLEHIISKALSLVAVLVLANAPDHIYVLLKHPETDLLQYGQSLNSFNNGVHQVVLLLCVIIGLQLTWDIFRAIFESYRDRSTAPYGNS